MSTLPEGWKKISIGEALNGLPAEVQSQVEHILLHSDGHYFETTKKLKQLLIPYQPELEKNGCDASYLAYAMVYSVLPALEACTKPQRAN